MACRYTYKGKVYSEEEFKALLASGELAKQHKEGKVKVQLTPKQLERMLSKAQDVGTDYGYRFGVAEGKIIGEIKGISKGLKEGAKNEKEKIKSLNKDIIDLLGRNKVVKMLPYSKLKKIMSEAAKVNTLEDLDKFEDKLQDIVYTEKAEQLAEKERKERVSAVRKNTRKISKASRSKVTLATDKSLLKGLGKVNVNRLEKNNPTMFEEFEQLAQRVVDGIGKPRINPKGELVEKNRWASNSHIQDFLDRYDEWLENDRKEEFFDAHLDFDISMDMTLDEMKQVVDSGKLKEGVNAEEVKANFEASVAKAKQQAKERIAELDKAFEGEELTPAEKEALKQIKKLNPDLLTPSQLMEVNQILENMVVNSSFDNSGTVVNLSIVTNDVQNAKKVLEKNGINKILGLFNINDSGFKKAGKNIIVGYQNVANIIKRMTLNNDVATAIRITFGFQDTGSGYANVQTKLEDFQKKFNDKFYELAKKDKFLRTYESSVRRSLASMARQYMEGDTIEEIHERFDNLKTIVKQTIEKKIRSGNYDLMNEASIEQKVYDELLDKALDGEEVYNKLSENEKQVVGLWEKAFAELKDDFDFVNRAYSNKVLPMGVHYTPFTYSKNKFEKALGEKNTADPYGNFAIKNNIPLNVARSSNARGKAASLKPGYLLSYDMESNNMNHYREHLYQIHTLAPRMRTNLALNNAEMIEAVGAQDINMLDKVARSLYQSQTGNQDGEVDMYDQLNKIVNTSLLRSAARFALASPTQYIRQVVNVLVGAGVRNPKYISKSANYPLKKYNDNLFKYSNIRSRINTSAGTKVTTNDIQQPAPKGKEARVISEFVKRVWGVKSKASEAVADAALRPLVRGDASVAKRCWMAYYEQYMQENKEWKGWDDASENPDRDASAYADQMIEETQGANSHDMMAQFIKDKRGISGLVKNIFFPFSSFAANQRARLMNDVRALRKARVEGVDATDALQDLFATSAEVATYRVIQGAIAYYVVAPGAYALLKDMFGLDDDEAEEIAYSSFGGEGFGEYMKGEIPASMLKEFAFAGLSAPVEKAGQDASNHLYQAITGDDKDLFYVPESSYLDYLGAYGITINVGSQLFNDAYTAIGGVASMETYTDEDSEFKLDDKQQAIAWTVAGVQFLNWAGFSAQELNSMNNKLRKAIVKTEKNKGVDKEAKAESAKKREDRADYVEGKAKNWYEEGFDSEREAKKFYSSKYTEENSGGGRSRRRSRSR